MTGRSYIAIIVVLVFLGAIDGQAVQVQSPAQGAPIGIDEVWAREEAYWRFAKAGDVENYLTLWNKDFRGWPCATEHPATKATIGDWVREIRGQKIRLSYALTREGAASVGGTVVVYYRTPMVYE